MIVSVNSKPEMSEFVTLMRNTDKLLNFDAQKRPDYYATRNGNPLEDDVKDALLECAKGTSFENTIEKISGQNFPDIVAAKYYGVEVKSTKNNHWTSTGSSILESSRIADVERIFMTFGKLGGNPIEFLSRPYEECLSGIAVTHMPRYKIDMRLKKDETIFQKMGISYDELRMMDNPVVPVSKYYRSQLKPGESLWWANDSSDNSVSATIRLWKNISKEEKKQYVVYGLINFPEIFSGNYDRYSLWLTSQGVVDSHIRDQFSAGGQELMMLKNGKNVKFPGIYRRVKNNLDVFMEMISREDVSQFEEQPKSDKVLVQERIANWIRIVSKLSKTNYAESVDILETLLFLESEF